MHALYTADEIRAAEAALMQRVPEGALMQRAAHGLAVQCAQLLGRVYGARVVLLIGGGNNGGDALFAGAELAARGARVEAMLIEPERAHAGGRAALVRAGGRVVAVTPDAMRAADLVIDGIVGIGGRGGLRGAAIGLAGAAESILTVAVDVPSGVDASTGAVGEHSVRADVTVTFGALKTGLVVGGGAARSGQVRLVDIGLDDYLPEARVRMIEADDVRGVLPVPGPDDDKYTRGVVGVVAGSAQYSGAGVLSTGAALVGGAGMVRYAGGAPDAIRARYPEVVVHPDTRPSDLRVQAWVVGPGLGTDNDAGRLLADVLSADVPVIVDADAITLVAKEPGLVRGRSAPTVLTPHDREFARIADGPGPDRLAATRAAAEAWQAVVLLKGNSTVIAEPDGTAYVNATGTPWLGTAGSGDVLSGLIGSLLASGLDAGRAAAVATFVHGVAGQRAATTGPPTAIDILDQLRASIASIERG